MAKAAAIRGANGHPRLSAELTETYQTVAGANHLLTEDSLARILALYRFVEREFTPADLPHLFSSEFASGEFLACVDEDGNQVLTPPGLVEEFQRFSTSEPGVEHWFSVSVDPRQAQPVLLPARWLCHLAGLRHGVVQLILTVANPDKKLLVQVRSMHKNSFPGRYDLPVAGHVNGLQSYEETLRKETREEIGLDIELLSGLHGLDNHHECIVVPENFENDCEYGRLFLAGLDPSLLPSLVPQSGEVAALALFPFEELKAMQAVFPNSFAPGIQKILDHYLSCL